MSTATFGEVVYRGGQIGGGPTRPTGTGSSCNGWPNRNITPYMRTRDNIHRKRSPFFGPERFRYEPEKQPLYLSC